MLSTVAFLVYISVCTLIQSGISTDCYDLEELSEKVLGTYGYYTALVSMLLFSFGGQIAYLVIIGETVYMIIIYTTSTIIHQSPVSKNNFT